MKNLNFNFDNTYANLPDLMATKLDPIAVKKPELIIFNKELADELNLDFSNINDQELAEIFSGNKLPEGSTPLAQAYCGHQFGHFVMLGDGRAILLGEHMNKQGKRFDVQLKGSGQTPYSRNGDGRAALGPMLREYLISEAIHALNIPTTRSLAVVSTGEDVQRETNLKGAILTRVASSHLRVGTFQYVAAKQDLETLKKLVHYSVDRHYPELKDEPNPAIVLFKAVMKKQIKLIVNWMRVSFIHGVMNTDNMTISGETIDYGPCAFMDQYDPKTVFSSIDHYGRYAFTNQPVIANWNLARFVETLLPLINPDQEQALKIAENLIGEFDDLYQDAFHEMMKKKLGFITDEDNDKMKINSFLKLMHKNQSDYTNTFRYLINKKTPQDKLLNDPDFIIWENEWQKRIERNQSKEEAIKLMMQNNPIFIPRNHLVEEALTDANDGNMEKFQQLLKILKSPYQEDTGQFMYTKPASTTDKAYKTYCGT
ncbi:YdiU family protein [Pelagibacteraceae bacterium]|nr:YdiU family protein [Pelagibacteraceae bacterium]